MGCCSQNFEQAAMGDIKDEPPAKEEIDDFIKANGVDDRAAADLRESSGSVQRAVLNRGDLSTARNPSAALLVRIRDARVGGGAGGGGGSGVGVGLPSSADIDNYIKRNNIDRRSGDKLRSSSPTVKRLVLASGDLGPVPDPAIALEARIAQAKAGGAAAAVPVGMAMPSSQDVEDFIKANEVDQSSADQLRSSEPHIQRVVISRGDLRSARNPSSALLARIRDAKAAPNGGMPGLPGMQPPPPPGGPPPCGFPGYMPPLGFPPPGFPPPPGDGNPGSGYGGYPPGGYGGYPGYGYPPPGYGGYGGYPGYPGGGYPGYPGAGAYTAGFPPPAGGSGANLGEQGSKLRGRSCSSSYSGSYSYSPSRSPSRSRSRRGHRAATRVGGKARRK